MHGRRKTRKIGGIQGSLGNVEKNLKELSAELGGAANETAYNQANRGSTGKDSSGAGEDRNQRGTRDHARGKAPEGERVA